MNNFSNEKCDIKIAKMTAKTIVETKKTMHATFQCHNMSTNRKFARLPNDCRRECIRRWSGEREKEKKIPDDNSVVQAFIDSQFISKIHFCFITNSNRITNLNYIFISSMYIYEHMQAGREIEKEKEREKNNNV